MVAARSILEAEARDTAGNVQAGASVYVFEADGVTPLGQVMYSSLNGSVTLTNPLVSDTSGRVQAYVANAQRCVLRVGTSGTPFFSEFDPDPGAVVYSDSATLTNAGVNATTFTLNETATPLADPGGSRLALRGDTSGRVRTRGAGLTESILALTSEGMATLLSATGDVPYASAAGVPARLPVGSTNQLLSVAAGLPACRADPTVGRNLLVNGTGRVKQVTLPTTDNAYGFDRGRLLMENANGFTLSQETSNLPAPGPGYAMRHIVGAGNNGKGGYFQPIRFARMRHVAGGVVSLQGAIYATAGIANMRMGVLQWTGTADNGGTIFPDPITTWGADGTNPTPSGTWTFAVAPTNLGAIAAWTATPYKVENIPISSSATNLAVIVWCDDRTTTQTTDYFIVTDLQLEPGPYCTQIERAAPQAELLDCLDWYERIYPSCLVSATNAHIFGISQTYSAPKWRAPTITKVGTFGVSSCGQPSSTARIAGLSDLMGIEVSATASATANAFFIPAGDGTSYFEIDSRL